MNVKISNKNIHAIVYKTNDSCGYTRCGIPFGARMHRLTESPLTCKICIKLTKKE